MMIKITKRMFLGIGIGMALLFAVGLIWIWWAIDSLPDVSGLSKFQPERVSEVYDQNGRAILQFPQNPSHLWVPLSEISETLQMAVITMEDDAFFQHKGINYRETWNAFKEDLKKGSYKRGGSTITQQLAKNLFLSKEKTLARKLKEYFLARQIERVLPKQRILELYLNEAPWGDGVYGAELASRHYFDKHASELSLNESTLLASMLANPTYYNPELNLERVQKRQKRLLALLQTEHMISEEEYQAVLQTPLELHIHEMVQEPTPKACPLNQLRDYVVKTYGETQLLAGGLRLKTTLDLTLQRMLDKAAVEAGVLMSQNTTPLLLAVKEGEMTRGLICIENGGLGMQVIKNLNQDGALPKDSVFSFENLETFRWEPLFPAQAVTVSSP